MSLVGTILRNSFGRPKGLLGKIGGRILARTNRKCAAWVVDLLGAEPGERAIEIGFGPGVGLELLASAAPSAKIAGADVSEEMLRQAAARNKAAIENGQIELRLASVENLPFPDQSFDKALSINSLQIWPDPAAGLREVWRVMKPDGRLAFAFTPQSGRGREGLVSIFADSGFSEVRILEGEDGFCVLATKNRSPETCARDKSN
ncbi:methyltransferase domain-containing protein [Methylocystis sp. IM4]|uniref:class I SAM-dependent methyltransferase n=1 Tax=Methylocystis sp. IM4 TaxID=3136560 RepID=UPI0031196D92